MTSHAKQDFMEVYKENINELDCYLLNQRFESWTLNEIKEDTRLFSNLKNYTNYVFDDFSNASDFIRCLVELSINKPKETFTIKDLLIKDNNVLELSENRLVLIME